jgi:hypothetical protein
MALTVLLWFGFDAVYQAQSNIKQKLNILASTHMVSLQTHLV